MPRQEGFMDAGQSFMGYRQGSCPIKTRMFRLVAWIANAAITLTSPMHAGAWAFESFEYQGPRPKQFQEAPQWARLVALGKLPPVGKRLPEDPLVVPTVEKIGKYGGTWRRAFTGPADRQNADRLVHDHLIYFDLDGVRLVPHIAKSWHASEDARVFTFYLRKGMKWSDGAPFSADDFVFAYEDLLLNEELNPLAPDFLKSRGKLGRLVKMDSHTIRYVFDEPFPLFLRMYAGLYVAGQSARGGRARAIYAPAHYLRQFHPRYASKAELDEQVRESGFDSWVQLFKAQASAHRNSDLPVVGPWKMVQPITAQLYVLERNPYYWAVDPQGSQLPYIDRIEMRLAQDAEVLNLRAIGGRIDMQHRHIHLAKVPLLKANAKKQNYRVLLWPSRKGAQIAVAFNQTWRGDPEIEKWLGRREFRRALSLAIDREAINETIFLGIGKVRSAVPPAGTPFYPGPEYETRYAVFDARKCNRILDQLGLKKRDAAGFRQRSDGNGRLMFKLSLMGNAFMDTPAAAELIEQQWSAVGIKVDLAVEERSLYQVRRDGNEHQMTVTNGGTPNLWIYPTMVPCNTWCAYAVGVGRWYETGGQAGTAPTGDLARLIDLYDRGKQVPFAQRIELGREIWRIIADNVYYIGMVGQSPAGNGVVVVKNNFRNVPAIAPNDPVIQNPGIARPEQFFFDN